MPYEPPLATRPVDGENPPPGPDPGPEPPPEPVPPPGSTAKHKPGQFVVAAEPIKHGEIGRAYIYGVCPAKVKILSESHRSVELSRESPPMLQSAASGSAQLLWKQHADDRDDNDVAWCLIRLGNTTSTTQLVRVKLAEEVMGDQTTPTNHAYDLYAAAEQMTDEHLIAEGVNRVLGRADAGMYWPAPDGSLALVAIDPTVDEGAPDSAKYVIIQCNERKVTFGCNAEGG